jgi:16S rRNA processing protein RimM
VDDLFLIAEIKAVHGSNGFVLIDSFSDFSERFFNLKSVFLEVFGSRKEFFIESVLDVRNRIAIKLKGFDSSEDVKQFIGKKVYVTDEQSVKPTKDTFFIHDLIGSMVFRESSEIGVIIDVLILPANDVLVVENTDKKRALIPVVKDYIKSFDAFSKRLELVPGCDLLYDDEN